MRSLFLAMLFLVPASAISSELRIKEIQEKRLIDDRCEVNFLSVDVNIPPAKMRVEAEERLKEEIKEILTKKGYHFNLLNTRYDQNARGVLIELKRRFKDIYIHRNMGLSSNEITFVQDLREKTAVQFGAGSDEQVISTALIDAYQKRISTEQSFAAYLINEGTFKSVRSNGKNTIDADRENLLTLAEKLPSCIDQ